MVQQVPIPVVLCYWLISSILFSLYDFYCVDFSALLFNNFSYLHFFSGLATLACVDRPKCQQQKTHQGHSEDKLAKESRSQKHNRVRGFVHLIFILINNKIYIYFYIFLNRIFLKAFVLIMMTKKWCNPDRKCNHRLVCAFQVCCQVLMSRAYLNKPQFSCNIDSFSNKSIFFYLYKNLK